MKNFEDSDNIYILLENCSKKSLVHVLKSRHVVTEPETRYYMDELGRQAGRQAGRQSLLD